MKAREYYTKYKDKITSADENESLRGVSDMIIEFCMESKELVPKRGIRTACGCVAVLRELNDKYNAVCRMFEQEYGVSFIKKDGLMIYWKEEVPMLFLS